MSEMMGLKSGPPSSTKDHHLPNWRLPLVVPLGNCFSVGTIITSGSCNSSNFGCNSSNLGPLSSISSLKAKVSKGTNESKQLWWRALQLRPDTSVVALWVFRFGAPRFRGAINRWVVMAGGWFLVCCGSWLFRSYYEQLQCRSYLPYKFI